MVGTPATGVPTWYRDSCGQRDWNSSVAGFENRAADREPESGQSSWLRGSKASELLAERSTKARAGGSGGANASARPDSSPAAAAGAHGTDKRGGRTS
eukprot:4191611-Prymnesium_polylepis.1